MRCSHRYGFRTILSCHSVASIDEVPPEPRHKTCFEFASVSAHASKQMYPARRLPFVLQRLLRRWPLVTMRVSPASRADGHFSTEILPAKGLLLREKKFEFTYPVTTDCTAKKRHRWFTDTGTQCYLNNKYNIKIKMSVQYKSKYSPAIHRV